MRELVEDGAKGSNPELPGGVDIKLPIGSEVGGVVVETPVDIDVTVWESATED